MNSVLISDHDDLNNGSRPEEKAEFVNGTNQEQKTTGNKTINFGTQLGRIRTMNTIQNINMINAHIAIFYLLLYANGKACIKCTDNILAIPLNICD